MSAAVPTRRVDDVADALPHGEIMKFGSFGKPGPPPLGDRLQKVRRAEQLQPEDDFLRALAREAGRSQRTGEPFSVVRLTGRRASDEDFALVSKFCADRLRITDEAGWIDARTIGILLPSASLFEARTVARHVFAALGEAASRFDCTIYCDGDDQEMPSTEEHADADAWVGSHASLTELFLIPMPFLKRAVDLVGATLIGLLALPFLLVSALAIRVESRGPVIFKQTRVGHGGKHFTLFKLRTMVQDAEDQLADLQQDNERDGPAFKIPNDPRITRVGKLLRKTCLDELPQLWNVLKGDMTLVGPRPPMPHEVAEYEAWHHSRLLCKGGLTCLWQVHGKPNNVSFQDWVRMDIRYQSQATPLRDLRLIAQTAWVVLSSRGDG